MTKARDLANFVSAGNPLADGTIDVADINGLTATATELNYTDGVTSAIQTQLDGKQAYDANLTSFVGAFTLPTTDGTEGQVLTTNGAGTLSLATPAGVPSGSVISYAGSSAPSDWLLCYGQAVSRSTYADLFTAIGTTYGVGDGSTTFNLPDLRGRTVAGQDDMGGISANRLTGQSGGVDGDVLGGTGGAETHTLSTAELASHTHNTLGSPDLGGGNQGASMVSNGTSTQKATSSAGSGNAHNNVQPTIILNYIIKT